MRICCAQHGVAIVLGPEAEQDLVDLASVGASRAGRALANTLPRLDFIQPDRSGLPSLDRYAALQMPDGSSKIVGATDATRGCKHRCRHCPIVPVYDGQFRAVAGRRRAGRHPRPGRGRAPRTSASAIPTSSTARRTPGASSKPCIASVRALPTTRSSRSSTCWRIEQLLPLLAATGCLFVTSAVESVDDEVLAKLEKGHTRADFIRAARLVPRRRRDAGADLRRVHAVDDDRRLHGPAARRRGSRSGRPTSRRCSGAFGCWSPGNRGCSSCRIFKRWSVPSMRDTLTYPWAHRDPRVDLLQQQVMALAGVRAARSREEIFETRLRAGAGQPDPAVAVGHPVSERALVLLSGAHRRAGGSVMNRRRRQALPGLDASSCSRRPPGIRRGCSRRRRRGSASSWSTRPIAAIRLDDPWRDGAIAVRFHEEWRSVDALLKAVDARPIDARARGRRSPDGDGRLPVAAARPARPSSGGRGRGARQAVDAREVDRPPGC